MAKQILAIGQVLDACLVLYFKYKNRYFQLIRSQIHIRLHILGKKIDIN